MWQHGKGPILIRRGIARRTKTTPTIILQQFYFFEELIYTIFDVASHPFKIWLHVTRQIESIKYFSNITGHITKRNRRIVHNK